MLQAFLPSKTHNTPSFTFGPVGLVHGHGITIVRIFLNSKTVQIGLCVNPFRHHSPRLFTRKKVFCYYAAQKWNEVQLIFQLNLIVKPLVSIQHMLNIIIGVLKYGHALHKI